MHGSESEPGLRPVILPRLGEVLPQVVQRFTRQGVAGLVLVRTDPLCPIEAERGADAHRGVLERIAGLVRETLAQETEDEGDELVVTGELGHHEIAVLLFRTGREGDFFRSELPRLAVALRQSLKSHGRRLVAPYMRQLPSLGVGYAACVRNPQLGIETQLRELLEQGRADAELEERLVAREQRRGLLGTILAGEVSSVYEPIVDVPSRTVFAYEALARGPMGTAFHSPLAMFGAAERESLVFELDCLCRRSGLEGAVDLPSGTALFLNVRPTTIHDPAFRPEELVRTLERTRLAPSDLVFEISEQEAISSFVHFREFRDEYRALGFRFALDDTGAGYASLEALIELEPEFVKVDRSLVAGLDADPIKQNLLRALQSVAGTIGARIIAEGLDTLEELTILGELGIDFGQGWLFGKPTPLRAEENGVDDPSSEDLL
ncbi:MAG: EAL domain-containing protein [Myxococcota bacterium]|nr:EAL domain-containing protein [Myxococcota bacterium]